MKWVMTKDRELINLEKAEVIAYAKDDYTEDYQVFANIGESSYILFTGTEQACDTTLGYIHELLGAEPL